MPRENPSNDISVRGIRESDLAAYKALRLEALRDHPESFGTDYEEDLAQPQAVWVERVRKAVEDPDSRIVVADADGELAGMTGVFRSHGVKNRHAAHIWGVYVQPKYRGRRLVDQMIEEVLNWCRSREVRIVRLSATCVSPAARCYQRCGFQVYGVSPEEIRIGERYYDELLMWRRV